MRSFLIFLNLLTALHVSAQHFCYTSEKQEQWFLQHPELKAQFNKHQQEAAKADDELFKKGYPAQQTAGKSAAAATYTIPIVFHILHTGGSENISDAQVKDAVAILCRDFNRANADTSDVVVQFKNKIGDTQLDFVLATRDPNGNCTNGIIRHFDANTDWTGALSEYAYSWPPTKYLNIYVVRSIAFGAAGYTYLPGSGIPAAMDNIVVLNNYVGSTGSSNVFSSRVLTHEVGHWLDLPHVWGFNNNPGQVCGDEGINDTPITKGFTSCNLNNAANCSPAIVENVQNYMDYSYCSRMFTDGQSSRMQSCLNGFMNGRNNLSSFSNLVATGVINPATNCSPKLDIMAKPNLTVCSGKTLSLLSFTSIANPTSYVWTANNSASVLNPSSATTAILFTSSGLTQVFCTVANANGSETKSLSVMVESGQTNITSQNNESFETAGSNLPSNWTRISPNGPTQQWLVTQGIASSGVKAMYIPGETFVANSIAILESPSYDFKNNPGAQLTVRYAYAKESATHADIFKVQASKDCGGTWVDVWFPSSSFLASGSGGITSELYLSPVGDEWRTKDISADPHFYSFLNSDNVRFRYYFQEDVGGTGFGNRLYLDQVVFSTPVGVNELTQEISLNVYPNPSLGSVNLSFNLSELSQLNIQVVSIAGAVLIDQTTKLFEPGAHTIQLNENAALESGIYFVNVEMNGIKMSRKLIIN